MTTTGPISNDSIAKFIVKQFNENKAKNDSIIAANKADPSKLLAGQDTVPKDSIQGSVSDFIVSEFIKNNAKNDSIIDAAKLQEAVKKDIKPAKPKYAK